MPETEFAPHFTGQPLGAFRRRVRNWYRKRGRELPWRRSPDAYRVWISEIMLQQTTVTAVVPYFGRFLERFPSVHELAAADESDVLRLWEGLGYYSRARNIHKTAQIVAGEFDGEFPQSTGELLELPGIGRYTAGAIASFAFDRPAGIVEANTLRLYARLLGYDGDPRSTAGQKLLWAFAERIVPRKSPGDFNHALMDLGATICKIAEPACEQCPVRQHCRACAEDRTAEIPVAARRPEITDLTEAAVVVRKNGRVLLRRCQPGERWAGLWDFPRFDVGSNGAAKESNSLQALETQLKDRTGIEAQIESQLDELRHGVTRYRIRLLCYAAMHEGGSLKRDADLQWVPVRRLGEYPLSVTGRKIAERIASR